MTAERPVCVQIAALGGQGGGVLAEWLTEAARLAGYPAQATSIPGVAQRTGATTYYFELFPERDPAGTPVFSLFPDADGLDLLAALEPTEAGRARENGLVTARTTVLTATARIYSTAEKMVAGDGLIPAAVILDGLAAAAGRMVPLDLAELSAKAGGPANAVMFGAIIASGVLPLSADDGRAAIRAGGKAVEANLAGFDVGLAAVDQPAEAVPEGSPVYSAPPPGFEDRIAALPEALRPLVGHALARLVDYQDAAYAGAYLDRLEPVVALDRGDGVALSAEVAKRLAAWMSYEDGIRVAQLKTRPGRLARIRGELGIDADAPFQVVEYLRPGPEEIAAILPPALARWVLRLGGGWDRGGRRVDTTSPAGYATFKAVAALRRWRPRTHGFRHENAAIGRWLDAVVAAARHDRALARQVAELAIWARGYGTVRRRGLDHLESLFVNWNNRLDAEPETVAADVARSLATARGDPDNDNREAA